MAIAEHVNNRVSGLSWAQADDVAKRLNPREGQEIVFAQSGMVLHQWFEREHALKQGSIYVARRIGGIVSAARSAS